MIVRKATVNDVETLIRLRLDYLVEDGYSLASAEREALSSRLRRYFSEHIGKDFVAVLAEEEGVVLSSAYLAVIEKPASPAFITGKTGTLMNVLTYAPYRRRGIATRVLQMMIDEARQLGVSVIDLFATEDGESLYRKLGFAEPGYTAMRLSLK